MSGKRPEQLLLFCTLTLLLTVFLGNSFAAVPHPAQVRPGFMTGDSDVGSDFYLDLLIPIAGDERSLLFFNPNFRFDDNDGNEQNIGFGYRLLSSCGHFILGGNAYYDTMKSEAGNRYRQWGVGAELLSQWVDLRANYYDVFGDDKHVLSGSGTGTGGYFFSGNSLFSVGGLNIEQALDGFDAEISVLIPGLSDFMETRLAATYFQFDADQGDDPDGWRARLDVRPVRAINLSIEYRDDDLRGNDTFVGGYLEIPFSVEHLLAGKNPFAGTGDLFNFSSGTRPLNERMTDKVIRDRHIVTIRSQTGGSGGGAAVVDDQMIFVSQDNEDGDGSYENPYHSLADAREDDRFASGAWIYVFSSDEEADTYGISNFTLLDDMVFWGQGYTHPVYGLGGGDNPILDGMDTPEASVITLADNNEVMGFTIQHGEEGIRGINVKSTNIHDNIIRETGGYNSGIHIQNKFTTGSFNNLELTYRFENNTIVENRGDGIYFDNYIYLKAAVDGLTITNTFANNVIQGNGGQGIYARNFLGTDTDGGAVSNSAFSSVFTDNIIGGVDDNGNGSHGILAISEIDIDHANSPVRNFTMDHRYERNQVIGNAGDGIRDETLDITFYATGGNVSNVDLSTYLADNTILNNVGNGYFNKAIQVVNRIEDGSIVNTTLSADFVDNEISDNGLAGIRSDEHAIMGYSTELGHTVSSSGFTDTYAGNIIERNGSDGIYLDSDFTGGADTYMKYRVVDNQINDNGEDGFYLYLDTRDGDLIDKTLFLQGNTITGSADDGVEVYVNGDTTDDFAGDFGGGRLGSTGGNTFANNDGYDIQHRGNPNMDIWALGNTWTNNDDPESKIYDNEITGPDVITSTPD